MQRPRRVEATELLSFHDTSYIEYLASVNLENQKSATNNFEQKYDEFNMGDDCPVFDGLFDFCRLYTGASLDGAVKLNHGLCDIAINWSGGLHHAKKAQASGDLLAMSSHAIAKKRCSEESQKQKRYHSC